MAHIVPHRLKELRKEAREAQIDLAAVIEKDRAMISNFERGIIDPMLEDLIKIARHYNVSPDYLLGWSDTRLPVKREQAGDEGDERALFATFRRLLNTVDGSADLLRLEGQTSPPARLKGPGKRNNPA